MYKRKHIIGLVLVGVMLLALISGCGSQGSEVPKEETPKNETPKEESPKGKTYVLRLGHVGSDTQPYHLAALKAVDLVKERTNGAVTINIYPNSQLGTQAELLEMLQDGTVDITLSAAGALSAFVPRVALTELPFLFDSREHIYATYDNEELMKKVWAGCESVGQIVTFYENGLRDIGSVGFAIESPKDVVGHKMRVMNSRAYLLMCDVLGMLSTTTSSGEVYTALQTGTAEIVDSPPPIFSDWAWSEIITDFTLTEHGYSSTPVVFSNLLKDKIGSEYYNIVVESFKETTEYARKEATEQYDAGIKRLEEAGIKIHSLTDESRASFVEKLEKSWDIFIKDTGDGSGELIKEIRDMAW